MKAQLSKTCRSGGMCGRQAHQYVPAVVIEGVSRWVGCCTAVAAGWSRVGRRFRSPRGGGAEPVAACRAKQDQARLAVLRRRMLFGLQ